MNSLSVSLYSLHEHRLHVHCFNDAGQLSSAVDILLANPQRRFAIDVAFEELDHTIAHQKLITCQDQVLISERALALLKHQVLADPIAVVSICDITFYPAVIAWGRTCGRSKEPIPRRQAQGWVASLPRHDAALASHASRAEIWDDDSYHTNELNLSSTLRTTLARARFILLAGTLPSSLCVLDNLGSCPKWVTSRRFRDLPLNVRQSNVLKAHHLIAVGELAKFGTNGLLKLPNLGLKSVRELGETVYELLLSGPTEITPQVEFELPCAPTPADDDSPFIDALLKWTNEQDSVTSLVIRGRWGLNSKKSTLQELGTLLGVTRERVRQLEVKALAKLRENSLWDKLATRIEALLVDRTEPLWLKTLHLEDPWFGDRPAQIATTLTIQNFLEERLFVFELNGEPLISRMSETSWRQASNDARLILGDPNAPGAIARAERLVDALLSRDGTELRGLLRQTLGIKDESDNAASSTIPANFSVSDDDLLSRKLRTEMLKRELSRSA